MHTEHAASHDEWLTVKEFADLKRVHTETVKRWIKQGLVIAERTAGERGHWRIKYPRHAA